MVLIKVTQAPAGTTIILFAAKGLLLGPFKVEHYSSTTREAPQ